MNDQSSAAHPRVSRPTSSLAVRWGAFLAALLVTPLVTVVPQRVQADALPPSLSDRDRGIIEVTDTPPADAPPADAWWTYTSRRIVDEGTGTYSGYSDALVAAGQYQTHVEGDALQVSARYVWRYDGERCDDGSVSRDVIVTLGDRRYQGTTDLDDYDGREGEDLATWAWIPPSTAVGATVRILERPFTVIERAPVEVMGRQIDAIHLSATGNDRRDDAYGSFTTTFTDEYWYDARSGYFLRSDYNEHDVGAVAASFGTFRWRETVTINGASYVEGSVRVEPDVAGCHAIGIGETTRRRAPGGRLASALAGLGVGSLLVFIVPFMLLVGGAYWYVKHAKRHTLRIAGQAVTVRAIERLEALPPIAAAESLHFSAFLRHFVEHALAAGERVACAVLADGRCVGLAIDDREGRACSMFAQQGDACELLRAHFGVTEFFTEHRHESLPSVTEAAKRMGRPAGPLAYNVLETYEVLTLSAPEALAYDTTVVSRMTAADLPALAALSQEVHGVRAERWLAAGLETGDLGFVARVEGVIVGYAFVTVSGTDARLYGNTVAAAHRGRGLGRELARARLTACSALGVRRVVTEVATWNVASLEVVRAVGFAASGTMWVETSLPIRSERKVVRR